ncbi:hypothetical protein N7533_001581 [Penicillium manginii]|uniref:uncharacterized protein n=1 Tax=Penicillium manginii TaxID=203109 RepID=UPI00254781ED|nr:uncharacterized protein N7533_001581 [Penicillium manginii]KAJ5762900.1 hypothetical protein N7533_001581 [Penicillium manginii]
MAYRGSCNCESISIMLPEQPAKSFVCHCDNCKKAGGGGRIAILTVSLVDQKLTGMLNSLLDQLFYPRR